jgi:hypothetical protein
MMWHRRRSIEFGAHAFDTVLAIMVFGAGVIFARVLLGTRFANWDDEGYVLISLQSYLKNRHLYSDVYSQYGPFYFLVGELCFRVLHFPLNHDGGRLITFLAWIISAAVSGRIVQVATGRPVLGVVAAGCIFVIGSALASEPMHPQFLVLMLSVGSIYLSFLRRQGWAAFGLGAIAAALALTKINVGLFYVLALLQTALLAIGGKVRSLCLCITALTASSLPLLLMRSYLAESWRYCLVSTICIASVSILASQFRDRIKLQFASIPAVVAGVVSTAALVVGYALLRGCSVANVIDGVVIWPSKHPGLVRAILHPPVPAILWSLLVPASSALLCYWIGSNPSRQGRFSYAPGTLCVVGGICAATPMLRAPHYVIYAMPLLALGFVPIVSKGFGSSALFGRLFLMNWCVIGSLQIWPLAGSQCSLASVPLVIWGFICSGDGVDGFCEALQRVFARLHVSGPRNDLSAGALARTLAIAILFCAAAITIRSKLERGRLAHEFYALPSSDLVGAHSLHLRPASENAFLFLSASVKRNCDLLFTLPGMFRLNLWSEVQTPNGWNLTIWMKGFDLERQQAILDILQSNKRACVVENSSVIRLWQMNESQVRALPLGRYILDGMPAIAKENGYVIRVHPERDTPWTPVVLRQ